MHIPPYLSLIMAMILVALVLSAFDVAGLLKLPVALGPDRRALHKCNGRRIGQ